MLVAQQVASQCVGIVEMRKDRKSTRLNSSHLVISYAVFCLKKKKKYEHAVFACNLAPRLAYYFFMRAFSTAHSDSRLRENRVNPTHRQLHRPSESTARSRPD